MFLLRLINVGSNTRWKLHFMLNDFYFQQMAWYSARSNELIKNKIAHLNQQEWKDDWWTKSFFAINGQINVHKSVLQTPNMRYDENFSEWVSMIGFIHDKWEFYYCFVELDKEKSTLESSYYYDLCSSSYYYDNLAVNWQSGG